ncbi:MAG: hypothetical protein LBT00_01790 [Spirochaetaceae bacterium]|nr:hypothetical protein [Spirochaetaceae bacterium]
MRAGFAASRLVMTMPSVIASGPLVRAGEAIQCKGLPRLDCFGLCPRNDDAPCHCEQAARKSGRSNPG